MAVKALAKSQVENLALAAAVNPDIDPVEAVAIVKMLLQAAAASDGMTAEVQVTIEAEAPQINVFGRCLVRGQVCTPIGCVCVCLVPPGRKC